MTRTFTTSTDQDAAIAWKAKQLAIAEDALITSFVSKGLVDVLEAYRDAEGSRVFDAFKRASLTEQDAVRSVLGLNAK